MLYMPEHFTTRCRSVMQHLNGVYTKTNQAPACLAVTEPIKINNNNDKVHQCFVDILM